MPQRKNRYLKGILFECLHKMSFRAFYNSVLGIAMAANDALPFSVEKVHFKKGEHSKKNTNAKRVCA